MRDLNTVFYECMEEVKKADIEPGNIIAVTVNTRAKKRWGRCTRNKTNNTYQIQISSTLLRDDVPLKSLKQTIIHEILHSCKNCMQHKNEWLLYANRMNRIYGYKIKRTNSAEDLGVPSDVRLSAFRYVVTCDKCGNKWYRCKKSGFVKNPQFYKCKCGGNLTVSLNKTYNNNQEEMTW